MTQMQCYFFYMNTESNKPQKIVKNGVFWGENTTNFHQLTKETILLSNFKITLITFSLTLYR
jgi:hypothetical protein